MSVAGYKTKIKRGVDSTSFIDETMSHEKDRIYGIVDENKSLWNRDIEPSFNIVDDFGSNIEEITPEWIDYMFGKARLSEEDHNTIQNPPDGETYFLEVTGGEFMTTEMVAGAHEYNLDQSANMLDRTDLKNAQESDGQRSRIPGVLDASLSISRYDDLSDTFHNMLEDRKSILTEIQPGGGSYTFRGWFVLQADGASGGIDDLETEDLTFELDGELEARKGFSWGEL